MADIIIEQESNTVGNILVDISKQENQNGLYYDKLGNFIEEIGNKATNVYLKDKTASIKIAALEDFEFMTAAVLGESSGNVEESKAIADVIINRVNYTKRTLSDIVQNTGIFGYNNTSKNSTQTGRIQNTNNHLKNARSASIAVFTGDTGGSHSAYFWDGSDIKTNKHFTEWGVMYTNPSHDIYGTGNSSTVDVDNKYHPIKNNKNIVIGYRYLYFGESGEITSWRRAINIHGSDRTEVFTHMLDSTIAIGGTVFWKYCPIFRGITGQKKYN